MMTDTTNHSTFVASPSDTNPSTMVQSKVWNSIMDYPALVQQEERINKIRFDVSGWSLYLTLLDEMLSTVAEWGSIKNKQKMVLLGDATVQVGDHEEIHRQLTSIRKFVGQRAVQLLPGSYKLWRSHLLFQIQHHHTKYHSSSSLDWMKSTFSLEKNFQRIQASFEDCLKRLHKMPRLWMDYLQFTVATPQPLLDITAWRRLVNRALSSLPVLQHAKLWSVVLPVLEQKHKPLLTHSVGDCNNIQISLPAETVVRMLRRYCMLDPTYRKTFAKQCLEVLQRPAEAALIYLELLNDTSGQTLPSQKYDLWMAFSDLACTHALACRQVGINFEELVRGALNPTLTKHGIEEINEVDTNDETEENETKEQEMQSAKVGSTNQDLGELEGTLWAKLANYFVRLGEFEMARSIYEEAMEAVSRVRDFSILYDAYLQLEEGILETAMAQIGSNEIDTDGNSQGAPNNPENGTDDDDWDILLGTDADKTKGSLAEMEWAIARAEHLTTRRPLLLNRVLLKQNPHNVGEWLTRSQLYLKQGHVGMAVAALQESIKMVHSSKAVNGSPSQLVLELARLYEEELKDVDKARQFLESICQKWEYQFRHVEDMAICYTAWVELELRHEQWDEALSLARQAVAPLSVRDNSKNTKIAKALVKSQRLWDLLLDLEESLGTVATTKDSYNRAMEIKVATPMHVLNYCSFLKERKYFEESFAIYERGVELFEFPASKVLWMSYLQSFIERYQGTKVERVRDLFERCLETCPPEAVSEFYLMNGEFEEKYGLTKRALGVYKAMCQKVPKGQMSTAYQLYIAKTIKYLGVTATRDVYQEAIAALDDDATAKLCLDFAKMESSLQEIDRARAILMYGAQLADPRRNPEYWATWHDFEVANGNEETFREMLRIKRSVQASFSTVNYNATDMTGSMENLDPEEALELIATQEGVDLDDDPNLRKQLAPIQGFVQQQQKRPASTAGLEDIESRVSKLRKATLHDDEIDIDDSDHPDDDDDDENYDDNDAIAVPHSAAPTVRNVSTKEVPAAVFGGLAAGIANNAQ